MVFLRLSHFLQRYLRNSGRRNPLTPDGVMKNHLLVFELAARPVLAGRLGCVRRVPGSQHVL